MMNQNVNKQINTTLVFLSVSTYSERFREDLKKNTWEAGGPQVQGQPAWGLQGDSVSEK